MSGVQLKDRRAKDLMLMKQQINWLQQTVTTGMHVLRREDGHILKSALGLEIKGQRKKRRSKEEKEVKGDMENREIVKGDRLRENLRRLA